MNKPLKNPPFASRILARGECKEKAPLPKENPSWLIEGEKAYERAVAQNEMRMQQLFKRPKINLIY